MLAFRQNPSYSERASVPNKSTKTAKCSDDDESLAGEYPRHANIARGAAVRDNNAAATENVQNILVWRLAAV